MSTIPNWSTTAASNIAATPNGWPEGQSPDTLNNCAREMMASIAKWYQDTDGSNVTAGTSNAYTLTTNSVFAALADISVISFRADRANTGAVTLNVDSLGSKSLKSRGADLAANALLADEIYTCAYNGTNDEFNLISAPSAINQLVAGGLNYPTSDGSNTHVLRTDGAGNLSFAAVSVAIGDHAVTVHTGGGHGSTNTAIRRFTTTLSSTGTAITYADSAANGASFTINDAGIYHVQYGDFGNGRTIGVSLNSSELTTSIASIAIADRSIVSSIPAGQLGVVSCVINCSASDIIRPHTDGLLTATTNVPFFSIRRLSTV